MGSQPQAESILARYNLAVFPVDESTSPEKQQKTAQRALERLERSIQVLPLLGQNIEGRLDTAVEGEKSGQKRTEYKMLTLDSLLD